MGCLVAIIIFLMIGLAVEYPVVFFILPIIGFSLTFYMIKTENDRKKVEEEQKKKIIEAYKKENNAPENTYSISYLKGLPGIDNQRNENNPSFLDFYMWVEDGLINLLDKRIDGVGKHSLLIDNILSFTRQGDVHNETIIEGGGGGGSSISGAVVGGVIAGEAGAIIGSRKKVNPITSKNIVVDKRQTIIEYKDNDNIRYIFLNSEAYDILLQLIPNKEITFVNKKEVKNDIYEKIEKLAELKEKGILTEEEFTNKKTQLLNEIL